MAVSSFRRGVIVAIEGVELEFIQKLNCGPWQLRNCQTGEIVQHKHEELLSLHEQGRLRFVLSPAHEHAIQRRIISLDLLPAELSDEAKVRYAVVKAVQRAKIPYLTDYLLEPIIKQVWESLALKGKPPHWNTVYRWCNNFEDGGKDIRALVSQHANKGNRKPRYDERTIEFCEVAINEYYLTPQRHTIDTVVEKAKEKIDHENKFLPPQMHIKHPTRSLITRLIRDIPAFDIDLARFGRQYALKKYRAVTGSDYAELPLQRAQMDHTRLDIMLIDEETLLPLGRPILTVCIDVATRYILGVHVSFEEASFVAVAECLKHAILSKEYIKARYPHIKHHWESYGVMEVLIVDNGPEFHSENFEASCYSIGIIIEYKPRKKPWLKGIVERFIGSLNRSVAHKLPGTTFSNVLELKDYDPKKTAVCTLADFMEHLHEWVCDQYHVNEHRTLKCAPGEMWRAGIAGRAPELPVSRDELEFQIGALDTRQLTHKGIELNGLLYNSDELTAMRKRLGSSLPVTVRHNPADISTIYVIDPETLEPARAEVVNGHWTKKMTKWQLSVCKRYAALNLGGTDMIKLEQAKNIIMDIAVQALGDKRMSTRRRAARYTHDTSGQRHATQSGRTTPAAARALPAPVAKVSGDGAHLPSATDTTNLDFYVDELPVEIVSSPIEDSEND